MLMAKNRNVDKSAGNVDKSSGKLKAGRPDWRKGERHPSQGRGPAKGAQNAGRPRDEWKAWLRSVVDSAPSRDAISAVVHNPEHPAYARVLAWADDRGYGKEVQSVHLAVSDLEQMTDDQLAALAAGNLPK
jgi:hypothetical protein